MNLYKKLILGILAQHERCNAKGNDRYDEIRQKNLSSRHFVLLPVSELKTQIKNKNQIRAHYKNLELLLVRSLKPGARVYFAMSALSRPRCALHHTKNP